MHLTTKQLELRGLRRLIISAACIAIAAGTTASALAFHSDVALSSAPAITQEVASTETVHMKGSIMATNVLTKVTPVYPKEAKEQKISGTVVLHAIIGKDGGISSLNVISGPDVLTKSAWEAVKQWKYKPYLLNGEPTAVDTTITVNYSLAN